MDVLDSLNITASGLAAQRTRLQTISSNLANSNTTRTADGGPYQRKSPVFESRAIDPFGDALEQQLAQVRVARTVEDDREGPIIHDPMHPDADEAGFVQMPNVDILAEMVDLMNTTRTYEANTKVLEATREMAMQAIEIGR
jgi:flagellar basal-body rod protein FlgC